MKLPMHRLFVKIFLAFWAANILMGISLVLTFVFLHGPIPARSHGEIAEMARNAGAIVVKQVERAGPAAAAAYIQQFEKETHLDACLFNESGKPIAGGHCESFAKMASQAQISRAFDIGMKNGLIRMATMIHGDSGKTYVFATELPLGPRLVLGMNRTSYILRWGIALLVSGLVCYLLARYLTVPILRLRGAAQQLAAGDLSSRATTSMERRNDEFGDLVRDFNSMAARIEELVSKQRQLLYDISHELRSPLARLNVALDLGRARKGDDPAFEHMEQDLECLSEMIGRLLTIARLDTLSAPAEMTSLNLQDLVSRIVQDAEFEAKEHDDGIKLLCEREDETGYLVEGNEELLHSAIENVIRNAIRYTSPGTSVEVGINRIEAGNSSRVQLTIRDHGPGVPQEELTNIFRPFYRVANARDRQSGGTGLGLAIAERVIRLHQGTIRAENAIPRGLCVEINLPLN